MSSKPLCQQAWDRYEIDLHHTPSPWIVDETFQSYLLLEVLASSTAKSTWLEGPLLHDYRWRMSYWHDKRHRLSSDLLLPVVNANVSATSSSSNSSMFGTLPVDDNERNKVFAFNFDWLDRSQQREINYSSSSQLQTQGDQESLSTSGMNGVYMIVELVHRVSGIPISRGTIRMSPQFSTANSDNVSIGCKNSIALELSSCYDVKLVSNSLQSRVGPSSHAQTIIDAHIPEFNCIISFIRTPSPASHWKLNRPLVLFPAFIPSPREVLNPDLPIRVPVMDQFSRPCRCFIQVKELQVAPDLLELCTSDRAILSAHCLGKGFNDEENFGQNPYAVLTPAFLGEMMAKEEAKWMSSSEIMLPVGVTSVSKIKLDFVGVSIGPESTFGAGIGTTNANYRHKAMELCCGVLSSKCKRIHAAPSSMYDPERQSLLDGGKGFNDSDGVMDIAELDEALESGVYEIPLFAHPTMVVVGYRNMDEKEPEGIFVGRIVVSLTMIGDGGESPNDASNLDPYLFPKLYNFSITGAGLYAHSIPTSVASSICDHIVFHLLSPDQLPAWMIHADAGDEMGRKNVYDKLGVVDTISCLAACCRRMSSQSSGLSRSLLSPGIKSGQKSFTGGYDDITLSIISHLVRRLLQPGLCDALTMSMLASLIEKAGASRALWCLYQSWVSSSSAKQFAYASRKLKSPTILVPSDIDANLTEIETDMFHLPSKAEFENARAACWAYRILGFNHHVERIHGLPIPMMKDREPRVATTASLAEDMLHSLLSFIAPMINHLSHDYSVCVEHAGKTTSDSALVKTELEKQRLLFVDAVADILLGTLECASFLLPVVGDMSVKVASAIASMVDAVVQVPFESLISTDGERSVMLHARDSIARMIVFLSSAIQQQPFGLDMLHRPAPLIWTKSSFGQMSAQSTRTNHSNIGTNIPPKRFIRNAEMTVSGCLTESIKQIGSFLCSEQGARSFRNSGGYISGAITVALRDLACTIENAISSRVFPRVETDKSNASSENVQVPSSPLPNLPPGVRRKKGGGAFTATAIGLTASAPGANTAAGASKIDINDVYARHKAFLSKDVLNTSKMTSTTLGKTLPLGTRATTSTTPFGKIEAGLTDQKDVTITAVRSLMENGSLAVELRSGKPALSSDEVIVYMGERVHFLDCLLLLVAAIGVLSEVPCDKRLGDGGAVSAPKSRSLINFILRSIIKSPNNPDAAEEKEVNLSKILQQYAQSKGPSGSYFVLLLIHVADAVELCWNSTTALARATGVSVPFSLALPHTIVPRLHGLEKAYLPVQLAKDVEVLTQAARTLFARVSCDEALSVAEVRAFSMAQKYRAMATQEQFKGVNETFLLSGADVCAISTWLRLRRHLMDSVVGVLRAGIRLGLFETDVVLAQAAADARDRLHMVSGSASGSRKHPHPATHDSFVRRLQALSSLADISSQTPTRKVSTSSFAGTPLNHLVWLLRDLADMEPLQQERSDLAILCLQSNDDAKLTLTTLFSIAVDLPVTRVSSELPASDAIARVLNFAREDLMGGCINVMQIMSVDVDKSPLTLEPYFQSLLDECILHCIPQSVKKSFEPVLSVLLTSSEPIEPGLVNGSPAGYAAVLSSLLSLLSESSAMTSRALWKMRERLTQRLTALRLFVLSKISVAAVPSRDSDQSEAYLRGSFGLIVSGAALQTLLHMAPQQLHKGGWGLNLRDRQVILQELTKMTPGNGSWNWNSIEQGELSVLSSKVYQVNSKNAYRSNELFDPLRGLGIGHRASQALLELSIGESIALVKAKVGSEMVSEIEYGEEEHRCGRAALTYMLQTGEWETGMIVATVLAEQCKQTRDKINDAVKVATINANSASIAANNTAGQALHDLASRLKRQDALQAEIAKAQEKLQQKLVHDGPLRPLPIYYAVRFLENPWIDADIEQGLRPFLDATNCHLQGFTTMTKDGSDPNLSKKRSKKEKKNIKSTEEEDKSWGQKKTANTAEEEDAPEGIGRGLWILLRCDPTSFSRNAEVYAALADHATAKLRKRKEATSDCSSDSSSSTASFSSDDEDDDGNSGDERAKTEKDRVHVPLPSACSSAIQSQLLRAFPSYQMLSPHTLVELDMTGDQTHPRALQVFQAFPSELCVAADAGLGSSETVGVQSTLPKERGEPETKTYTEDDYETSATFKANDALKSGILQPQSDWEIAMHTDTFFVFAAMDRESEMSEHAASLSDAGIVRLTLTTVSSAKGAEAAKGHTTDSEMDDKELEKHMALLAWAGKRNATIGRMHTLAPASLLFIADAKRLTAFEAAMSVIRHQLQALNRVQFGLSNAAKLTSTEIMQQTAHDITSNTSIMAAAASTVANMIVSPPSLCVGVHNARVLVAGESDRLETLWQRQRKQAKREYMRLVSKYEAELKEAVDYGLDSHHHPEPPEDPDFEDLEDQHQLTRLNLERLSARRISCISLIENLLQHLRLCSMVIPSRAMMDSGLSAATVSAKSDLFNVYTSPTSTPHGCNAATTLSTDDIHSQLDTLNDIEDEDEMKNLWLQVTLWLEAAVAGLEFATV